MTKTFVYKGSGSTGVTALAQFEAMIGRKVDGVVDFVDYLNGWAGAVSEAQWALAAWKGVVDDICLTIPLAVTGGTLEQTAAGAANASFAKIAQAMVANGFATGYARLGHEFNGGWYPWAANGRAATYNAAYRQAVTAMRAVAPGLKFVWCTALYEQQFWPTSAYPGDDVVDVVAVDAYNTSYDPKTIGAPNVGVEPALWNAVYNDGAGVASIIAFAKQHGKPYAFPEWGTGVRGDGHGGGDDPTFIADMAPLIAGSEFHAYWDYAGDYCALLSAGARPQAAMAFIKAFASPNAKAIFTQYAKPFTPEPAPVLDVTNCHASAIQNAPGHWMIIVWAQDAHPSASVGWGFKASNANVYDAAAGAGPIKPLGAASSWSGDLAGRHPLIIAVAK